jgi:hypothetical protein
MTEEESKEGNPTRTCPSGDPKQAAGWRELAASCLIEAATHPQSQFPPLHGLDAEIRAAWIGCAMAARDRAKALEEQ